MAFKRWCGTEKKNAAEDRPAERVPKPARPRGKRQTSILNPTPEIYPRHFWAAHFFDAERILGPVQCGGPRSSNTVLFGTSARIVMGLFLAGDALL